MANDTALPAGIPELMVLRLLHDREMYGYEIVQAIALRSRPGGDARRRRGLSAAAWAGKGRRPEIAPQDRVGPQPRLLQPDRARRKAPGDA